MRDDKEILYSVDGGKSYTSVSVQLNFPAGFNDPVENTINDVYMAQDGTVLIAVKGAGLLVTTDRFATFSTYTVADGIGITGIPDAVRVAADGVNHWMFTGSNGRAFISTDRGLSFTRIDDKPGYACASTPIDLEISTNKVLYAACFGAGLFISTDSGQSWILRTETEGLFDNSLTGLYKDPASNKMYINYTLHAIQYTDDEGSTFYTKGSADGIVPGPFLMVASIYIENDGTVYIAAFDIMTSQNTIAISTDGGGTFSTLYTNQLGHGLPRDIAVIGAMTRSNGNLVLLSPLEYLVQRPSPPPQNR